MCFPTSLRLLPSARRGSLPFHASTGGCRASVGVADCGREYYCVTYLGPIAALLLDACVHHAASTHEQAVVLVTVWCMWLKVPFDDMIAHNQISNLTIPLLGELTEKRGRRRRKGGSTNTQTHTHKHVCMHTHIHIHTHTYTPSHTHIHTQTDFYLWVRGSLQQLYCKANPRRYKPWEYHVII